jgi:uncharacterized protein (TIGR00255 family)
MRSMTGHGLGASPFASADGSPRGSIEVELRTVNHRFLDVRVRVPRELVDLSPLFEQLARESLSRGRVDISVRADLLPTARPVLDRARAKAAYLELVALRDEVAPGADVPLSLLSGVPDLFAPAVRPEDDETLRGASRQAFAAALGALGEMREREGQALATDLKNRLTKVGELADAIAARSPDIVEAQRKRLRERAERLRASVDVGVDDGRLEAEIVLFAERVDVAEELTRLRSHCAQVAGMLNAEGAIGRRLEFLLQEMQREANTAAAKCGDAKVSHAVVDIKAEIERMREQVQNVE